MKDLRLSAEAVAGIFQGEVNQWDEALIADDNPGAAMPAKRVESVGRADRSAATYWLSSWLTDQAHDAWTSKGGDYAKGAITIFPAPDGRSSTGTEAVADSSATGGGHGAGVSGRPEGRLRHTAVRFLGFVYLSEALKLGLPVAALQNASGNYVLPTTESVTAAFNAGTIAEDGTFTPNFKTTDPNAYPLPVMSYVITGAGTSRETRTRPRPPR